MMYVIFDTNIWISELGLKTTLGSAVRFFVNSKKATVVVPEVIRFETEANLKIALTKYLTELSKNYRQLLTIFGALKELVLPDQALIEEKVASVFGACQLELIEIPFSIESAKSSFTKTINKVAPSDKDQQFKDGVIWADILRLLQDDDVYFVTEDKAFYRNRDYKNGLASDLESEARGCAHNLYLFHNLSDFLKEIRTEIKLDKEKLPAEYWESNRKNIEGILERNNFAITGSPYLSNNLFVTEDPNRLYVEFELLIECDDLLDEARDGILKLNGDCTYYSKEDSFSNFRSRGEEVSYTSEEGRQTSKCGYLYADNVVIGHRTVDHSVKLKITE